MSDDIGEIFRQWELICAGRCNGSIPEEEAREFHEKHGRAMVAEIQRFNAKHGHAAVDVWNHRRHEEMRSRPCPVCGAEVGKPCKEVNGDATWWHHEERRNKEAS